MKFWDRLTATLRADAHGMIDAIEDRALVLKQHLRDAEIEVQRKRGQLSALEHEQARLHKDRERVAAERVRYDSDAELALQAGKDELARHALQRLLPLQQLELRMTERANAIADERRTLQTLVAQQDTALSELRIRVGAFLAEHAQGAAAGAVLVARPVEPEQVEIELLRRKRAHQQAADEEPSDARS